MILSEIIDLANERLGFKRPEWDEDSYLYFNCEGHLCFSIPFEQHALSRLDMCSHDWKLCGIPDGLTV